MKRFFAEIPYISSGNLELRQLQPSDADGLHELTECDEVYRYLPTFLFEKQFDDAGDAISRMYDECLKESLILGIFYDGEFCGLAEFYGYRASLLKISVAYRLLPRFWGRGIATKTVGMMTDYLFRQTDIRIITASVIPDNGASSGVLRKSGFHCAPLPAWENWGYPHLTKAEKWRKVKGENGSI